MEGIIKSAGIITIIAGLFSGIIGTYFFVFSLVERPTPIILIGFIFMVFGIAAIFYVIKTFKYINTIIREKEKDNNILDDEQF